MPAFMACNEEKAAIKRAVNERVVNYLRYNNFYLELLSILKKFISLHKLNNCIFETKDCFDKVYNNKEELLNAIKQKYEEKLL